MKKIIFLLIFIIPFISACIKIKTNNAGGVASGGFWRSLNKGGTWQQRSLIPTVSGKPKNFNNLDMESSTIDPSDYRAIYFGSVANGLFYSYDGGESWMMASKLGKVTIRDIAIDPYSKCIIYVAVDNKLFRSNDCSRTWTQVYYDNNPKTTVNSIIIDHYDSNNVYIGMSRGEIIKSSDRGLSWHTLYRFPDDVLKIAMNPHDSRILFVATVNKGLFRSRDGGEHWESLKEQLKEFKNSNRIKDLVIPKSENDEVIFLATKYGMLRSWDQGDTWEKIKLIVPEKESTINSMDVNPKNVQEIYYVTNTTFYRSLDGGENWTTKKLPSPRAGQKVMVNYEKPNIIYLGFKDLKK